MRFIQKGQIIVFTVAEYILNQCFFLNDILHLHYSFILIYFVYKRNNLLGINKKIISYSIIYIKYHHVRNVELGKNIFILKVN